MTKVSYRPIVILSVVLIVSSILAIGYGALSISPLRVLEILMNHVMGSTLDGSTQEAAVLWGIRLPRVLLAISVGATLSVSGAVLQGVFRNPLAEPGLIGISAGASLAAALFMIFGSLVFGSSSPLGEHFALPLSAFVGAISCTLMIYRVSVIEGRTSITTMLLAGVAFNAIGFSLLGILQYIADDEQLRSLTFWMLGSLGAATWEILTFTTPMMLITLFMALKLSRQLNLLQLGEAEALHLGVDIEQVKRASILSVALGVGAAVSVSGMIGFIGLVVPHIIRIAITPNHKILIPASALLGSTLLLGADLIARTIVIPSELPVGIVTTLLGAPVFILLIFRLRWRLL